MFTTQRLEYTRGSLERGDLDADPIRQFQLWLDVAVAAAVPEPNAMALATSTRDGQPSCRMVLLRGFDERGFCFYTNYQSRKGLDLESNPRAALAFFWQPLERQVRIEGPVEHTSEAESDFYFASRPATSRVGACVSPQSQVITDRAVLELAMSSLAEPEACRPPHWGGYRVIPEAIEFWQGRPGRLHDRFRYRRADGSWLIERLAP